MVLLFLAAETLLSILFEFTQKFCAHNIPGRQIAFWKRNIVEGLRAQGWQIALPAMKHLSSRIVENSLYTEWKQIRISTYKNNWWRGTAFSDHKYISIIPNGYVSHLEDYNDISNGIPLWLKRGVMLPDMVLQSDEWGSQKTSALNTRFMENADIHTRWTQGQVTVSIRPSKHIWLCQSFH